MLDRIKTASEVPAHMSHHRLDQVAVHLFSQFSRARLQAWIKAGALTVDGKLYKAKDKVLGGQCLLLDAEYERYDQHKAEAIAIKVCFEDEELIIINKAANTVVHPAAGNWSGTLMNALLHHCPSLAHIPRAGIVHRLDKDTTGLMVIAKTLAAQQSLVAQLQTRTLQREYEAVVYGLTQKQGCIRTHIGRHPHQRTKMAVVSDHKGKEAITYFQTLGHYGNFSHLRLQLKTGRTHQIRVHCTHIKHPLVGDPLYKGCYPAQTEVNRALCSYLAIFNRQALHARRLTLEHPQSSTLITFEAELPKDMQVLLEHLVRVDSGAEHDGIEG